jgi:ubiquinone/menaquinone biosynthesis C-methylase UbiE
MPTVDDVRAYWNAQPLFSHEIEAVGSEAYFDQIDAIKRNDVERFALSYWEFERFRGRTVLDIGCGPGWLSVQYARAGAGVTAVDLTERAVQLTGAHLARYGLTATVRQANAEELPFADNSFDLIVSSGVLHHTPNTQKAFSEAYRLVKPAGAAKITLYRLGVLHSRPVFPVTMALMHMLSVKHPGADMSAAADSVQEFVRQYDGAGNPIGIAKRNRDWAADFRRLGFRVVGRENHFFPVRFTPFRRWIPPTAHRFLDRAFGTMAYFNLQKPVA